MGQNRSMVRHTTLLVFWLAAGLLTISIWAGLPTQDVAAGFTVTPTEAPTDTPVPPPTDTPAPPPTDTPVPPPTDTPAPPPTDTPAPPDPPDDDDDDPTPVPPPTDTPVITTSNFPTPTNTPPPITTSNFPTPMPPETFPETGLWQVSMLPSLMVLVMLLSLLFGGFIRLQNPKRKADPVSESDGNPQAPKSSSREKKQR